MNRILFVRRKKKKPEESLAKNYRVHCVDSDTDAWNVLDKEKFDAILLWMEEDSAIPHSKQSSSVTELPFGKTAITGTRFHST